MKTCTKCKIEQPLSEFYTARRQPDGLTSNCKSCFRAYRESNRERLAEWQRTYRRDSAQTVRANDRASKAKKSDQRAEANRAWRAKNAERHRESTRRWQRDNPVKEEVRRQRERAKRLARRRESTFLVTETDMRRLMRESCAVTGCSRTDKTIDHVTPLARGGTHSIGNLQILCGFHNSSKGSKLWIEFRAYLARQQALAA